MGHPDGDGPRPVRRRKIAAAAASFNSPNRNTDPTQVALQTFPILLSGVLELAVHRRRPRPSGLETELGKRGLDLNRILCDRLDRDHHKHLTRLWLRVTSHLY